MDNIREYRNIMVKKQKQVAVCLKPHEIEEIKELADQDDRSVSDYCARLLRKHLSTSTKEEGKE